MYIEHFTWLEIRDIRQVVHKVRSVISEKSEGCKLGGAIACFMTAW